MSEMIKNRYQITNIIGKGGMADVYLAWDTILNREVAIKILKADMADDDVALERFKREAGATTQLSHPNIVDVYDVGDDDKKHYIVMEYVKGYTLKQLIKKRGAIPYKEAVWMMKQLAGALMEAHRKGIIHRDVKSQNVLIKPDGTIKLSDFGIALANGSMQITHKDSVLGSVHYLAPELTKGRQASMQSDIYSLGIVFYELLTGDVPFKADTPIQVALMHVKNNIIPVRRFNRDIPQSVENIIIKATAKSLNDRYKNIAIMLKDLNECLKSEHLNDKPIDLSNNGNYVHKNINVASDSSTTTTIIKKKGFKTFYISLLSILAIGLLLLILFLTGVISPKDKIVKMPDITNLTIIEARDILTENNLSLDESHIEYQNSETIEKDHIISFNQVVGDEVDINTKVKVTVSLGIYSTLDNYVGKNYKEADEDLKKHNFVVRLLPVESDKQPGEVIEQSLPVGYKYDSQINNEITIKYAKDSSIILDLELKGKPLSYVEAYFSQNEIKYELVELNKDEFSENELKDSNPDTLISCNPELGSSYTQDSDSKVSIYYYSE